MSDPVLARRAGLGDRAAFVEIFHRHGGAMFRYALQMLDGDVQGAEDAVQVAWIKVWQHLDGFRGESQLRTWLFSITAHEVLSARRRRRPLSVDDQLLSSVPARRTEEPAQRLAERELEAAIHGALTELPWRQRAAWVLREMEGLSYDEIAAILGTSPGVVRGLLHRARSTLVVRMSRWR